MFPRVLKFFMLVIITFRGFPCPGGPGSPLRERGPVLERLQRCPPTCGVLHHDKKGIRFPPPSKTCGGLRVTTVRHSKAPPGDFTPPPEWKRGAFAPPSSPVQILHRHRDHRQVHHQHDPGQEKDEVSHSAASTSSFDKPTG